MQKIDGCSVTTAVSTEDILKNISISKNIAVARNLRQIHELQEWREQAPIAIVGGGPSLKDNLKELKRYENIIACGSVHDFLIDNIITPNWCVLCDPDEIMANYLRNARLSVKYLVASQCHQRVWDRLDKYSPIIWHASGSNVDTDIFNGEVGIGGGCTVGTRAMIIAMAFGFKDLHFFGMDTCLSNDYKHHAYEFHDPEKETIGNIFEIKLGGPESPTFKVAGYMLGQLFDFKAILKSHAGNINVKVFGGGLLDYVMKYGELQHSKNKQLEVI